MADMAASAIGGAEDTYFAGILWGNAGDCLELTRLFRPPFLLSGHVVACYPWTGPYRGVTDLAR